MSRLMGANAFFFPLPFVRLEPDSRRNRRGGREGGRGEELVVFFGTRVGRAQGYVHTYSVDARCVCTVHRLGGRTEEGLSRAVDASRTHTNGALSGTMESSVPVTPVLGHVIGRVIGDVIGNVIVILHNCNDE